LTKMYSVHFQIVMDCTEYIKGDSLVEVYNRVTKDGELEQIPHDLIDEVYINLKTRVAFTCYFKNG